MVKYTVKLILVYYTCTSSAFQVLYKYNNLAHNYIPNRWPVSIFSTNVSQLLDRVYQLIYVYTVLVFPHTTTLIIIKVKMSCKCEKWTERIFTGIFHAYRNKIFNNNVLWFLVMCHFIKFYLSICHICTTSLHNRQCNDWPNSAQD